MEYSQQIFLGTSYYGTQLRQDEIRSPECSVPPQSYLYCCRFCGDVWARVLVSHSGEYQPFTPIRRACLKCWDRETFPWGFPGTLWLPLGTPFNHSLPEPLLKRDFELHCAWRLLW